MLLGNSISKAKKLLNSTFQSFKNMLSGGYERLPKTPPFSIPFCATDSNIRRSFRELDSFYEEFSGRWAAADQQSPAKKKKKKKDEATTPPPPTTKEDSEKFRKLASRRVKREVGGQKTEADMASHILRVETCSIVARRLKELERMDVNNLEHVLDIEEVLHYYSRITCPLYVDIVNHFFMEMYAEFIIPPPQASPAASSNYISRQISHTHHL
ncbi:hypothetical protein ACLOJK_020220 [Asimina triloba]